jgi:hypothetical protein
LLQKWIADYHLDKTTVIGKSHYELFLKLGEEMEKIHQKCLTVIDTKREEDSL